MCQVAHRRDAAIRPHVRSDGFCQAEHAGTSCATWRRMRIEPAISIALMLVACSANQAPSGNDVSPLSSPTAKPSPSSSPPAVHRATAVACPTERPVGTDGPPRASIPPDASSGTCSTDADCTAGMNGRCDGSPHDGWTCSYDTCSTDADCGGGELCSCRTPWPYGDVGPNRCLPSNCRVDADCGPGGYCSPTLDAQCGSSSGVTGWYCHKPGDSCVSDGDCKAADAGPVPAYPPSFCGYQPQTGAWACLTTGCAG